MARPEESSRAGRRARGRRVSRRPTIAKRSKRTAARWRRLSQGAVYNDWAERRKCGHRGGIHREIDEADETSRDIIPERAKLDKRALVRGVTFALDHSVDWDPRDCQLSKGFKRRIPGIPTYRN